MNITCTILKELRLKNNLTLEELAEEINKKYAVKLTKSMISKWETGKATPVYDHLKRLALYYNVTTDFILGFDSYENLITDSEDTNKKTIRSPRKHNAIKNIALSLENDKITTKDLLLIQGIIDLIISGKSNNSSK